MLKNEPKFEKWITHLSPAGNPAALFSQRKYDSQRVSKAEDFPTHSKMVVRAGVTPSITSG